MTKVELKTRTEKSGSVTFHDWTDGRRVEYFSTNAGAPEIAFQGWRKFKEAFAPELIAQAYEETSVALGRKVKSCIDPFGGSGTTGLACQFLDVRATTVEVNPFLADLIESKLATYDLERLIKDFSKVLSTPRSGKNPNHLISAPLTFVEPGLDDRFIFSKRVAKRLCQLMSSINSIRTLENRRLLKVLLGSVSIDLSNVVVSGKGRRYRSINHSASITPAGVDQKFASAVTRAIFEIRKFADRKSKHYSLIRGDCRKAIPLNRRFDMAVFSPPYPNSFDYTDVYNVELWVCGYLSSSADNRKLRMSTLRSHVQLKREAHLPKSSSASLTKVLKQFEGIRSELWNKNIPEMIGSYFADMESVLLRLKHTVVTHGRIYIVVGDSQYSQVKVPVAKIICEISEELGFTLIATEPFRSMLSSPQQGGRRALAETLLTLSR